ncbi:ATP-grasp domain-containing protein [Crocinitomix catalasitica]|uniref:ATP-grasp domain-containing protein n=1 Tax=Crocinitomix catalasitica TaxID=184607 RepID=UPI00047F2BFD|nr:RimK family alpha-L-glutamate ligase [Crocinitomix catalasitica]
MLIYILSRGANLYSTTRLYQAAFAKKHNVRIIDHMHCDLLIEDGIYKVIFNGEVLIRPDAVIARIGSSNTYYGTTVVKHFEEMKVPVYNTSKGILASRDKFRSMQILAASKIRIPKTYFSYDLHQAERIIAQKFNYPVIAKLIEGTQGAGVYLLNNQIEANNAFNKFISDNTKVLLQEFIAEFKGKDIRAFVIGGKVVAAMMRIAEGDEFRSNLHRGGRGEKIVLSEEEKEMAVRSVKALGLKIGGVDILRSKKGSMVIEVNSSPGLEGIEAVTEIAVADKIITYIEEHI